MTKKILIYTGYFIPHLGGVERYVDKLTSALEKIGYQCTIVTTAHDNSLPSKETIGSRTIYRLPTHNIFKQRYPIINKRKSANIISDIDFNSFSFCIVNTRFHLTSLLGARLAKKHGIKVALIEHGTAHFSVGNKLLDFFGLIYEHVLTAIIKLYVDYYYGVSQNCNKWLKHFGISAEGVWYNAIDSKDKLLATNKYDYFDKREIIVTYAGRIIKEKGIINLLKAFDKVRSEMSNQKIRLVIAGDGPLKDELESRYLDDSSIQFLGKINFSDILSLFKRTDIFVHPSLYPEGLPTAILEAGLMRTAIIATPRGGTEEVIIDKRHGIIVDGSVDSLKIALMEMVQNESMRKKSADNVKKRIESVFSWQSVAKCVDNKIKESI